MREMVLDDELIYELPTVPQIHRQIPGLRDRQRNEAAPEEADHERPARKPARQNVIEAGDREREHNPDQTFCKHREPNEKIEQ